MKGNSHPTNDVSLNTSANASIRDVIDAVATSRRQFVKETNHVVAHGRAVLCFPNQFASVPQGTQHIDTFAMR